MMLTHITEVATRIKGFVTDEAFPQGRWLDKAGHPAPECAVTLPIDKTALSKDDDPHWRKHQYWAVFRYITHTRYRVWYATEVGETRRTLFSYSYPLFALRVGPGPLTRVWVEKQNGRWRPPELVGTSGRFLPFRTVAGVKQLSYTHKMPIVFL